MILTTEQAKALQIEIESKYIDIDPFDKTKDDIRQCMFNYDNYAWRWSNEVRDVRLTQGLIKNGRRTYLVYVNGVIVAEAPNRNDGALDMLKLIDITL